MTRSALTGLHHLSAMSSDAQDTVDFYAGILGLPLLKQTVNFDDPNSYHLYFGDRELHIGTMTFFVWPGALRGQVGRGGTRHVSFPLATDADLERWDTWLEQRGIPSTHEAISHGDVLRIEDPDGLRLELVHRAHALGTAEAAGASGSRTSSSSDGPRLGPIDQVAVIVSDLQQSHQFYAGLLGLNVATQRIDESVNDRKVDADSAGNIGVSAPTVVLVQADETTPKFRLGAGLTHHFAMRVASDEGLVAWRDFLNAAGVPTTDVKDRRYFQSIYFRDPDGHVVEIATNGPGFTVDEPTSQLGQRLSLPPWLESGRAEIERRLPPLQSLAQSLK